MDLQDDHSRIHGTFLLLFTPQQDKNAASFGQSGNSPVKLTLFACDSLPSEFTDTGWRIAQETRNALWGVSLPRTLTAVIDCTHQTRTR